MSSLDLRSVISRFGNYLGNLGFTHAGQRDTYKVFGYPQLIDFQSAWGRFERQGVAARIVESVPDAIWGDPPAIKGDQVFDAAWQDLKTKHDIYQTFYRVDCLAGIGRYAVMLLGFNDGKDLKEPLIPGSASQLLYVQPYSEAVVEILEWYDDPQNPKFGEPKKYRINPQDLVYPFAKNVRQQLHKHAFEVHESRILHITEKALQDNIIGQPRMQRCFNLLIDLEKVSGGGAETFWIAGNRGIQADLDPELQMNAEDAAQLTDEIEEYMNNLRRFIRTRGVKINPLGSDVADPRGNFSVIMAQLSATTGIPQRILLGSEAGQLASEQDRANWAVKIENTRKLHSEPVLIKPFINRCVEAGVLPAPLELHITWPDAFRMSPLERAMAGAQKARSLANVAKALESTEPFITVEEGRELIGFSDLMPIFDGPEDSTPSTSTKEVGPTNPEAQSNPSAITE